MVIEFLPNREKHAIQSRAFRLGVKYLSYDKDYFEKIDTPAKAYWLGFLYADGYTTTGNRWGLQLQHQDKLHLEKFAHAFSYNGKIRDRVQNGKQNSSILINNKKMCNDLKGLGVINNKTAILTFPNANILPERLQPHFIRGFFDGDGCITWSNKPRVRSDRNGKISNRMVKEVNIIGVSKGFIDAIYVILQHHNIKMNYTVTKRKGCLDIYVLRTSKLDTIQSFSNYIYRDADAEIMLSRKFDKFNSLLSATNSSDAILKIS